MNRLPDEQTRLAATISMLAEGVAVLLLFCMGLTWLSIYATEVKHSRDGRAPVVEMRR